MNNLLTLIMNDPVYLTILVIISFAIIFSIVKKLFKLSAILITICIIYLGYLHYTGQEIPINTDDLMNNMGENTEEVIEGIEDAVGNLKKKSKDIIKNAEKVMKEKTP